MPPNTTQDSSAQPLTCGWCGTKIPPKRKYCSLSCGTKKQRSEEPKYTRIGYCKHCGKVYSRNKDFEKVYCSHSCSATANNRERKRKPNCRQCGKKCKYVASIYCSRECSGSGRSAKFRDEWLRTGTIPDVKYGKVPRYAREVILAEQEGRCAICSMEPVWEGKPLVFIADHIDGDSNNNHRSNLRLIDSNCDSQLDSYKSKNSGQGRAYRRERYADGKSY